MNTFWLGRIPKENTKTFTNGSLLKPIVPSLAFEPFVLLSLGYFKLRQKFYKSEIQPSLPATRVFKANKKWYQAQYRELPFSFCMFQ